MPETTVELDELEERVNARFREKVAELWPLPDIQFEAAEFSPGWDALLKVPLPPGTPQFPREQWVIYPHRRTITLLICDRMIDQWDDLTPEQQGQVGFLLTYGGRERIA